MGCCGALRTNKPTMTQVFGVSYTSSPAAIHEDKEDFGDKGVKSTEDKTVNKAKEVTREEVDDKEVNTE